MLHCISRFPLTVSHAYNCLPAVTLDIEFPVKIGEKCTNKNECKGHHSECWKNSGIVSIIQTTLHNWYTTRTVLRLYSLKNMFTLV